ncbi:MAG: hypothetical protein ABSC90_16910 [Acidimicrobiales bacterium]|jgi:hypothetical protein
MQLSLLLLLGAVVLSLGPYLEVDGRSTTIRLPFLILDHLPLLDDILPYRISFVTDGCLAAVVAFGLDDIHRTAIAGHRNASSQYSQRWAYILIAMVLLAIVLATGLPQWPPENSVSAPAAVELPTAIRRSVPTGDPVALTYPFATEITVQPMLWQADDGYRFRLLGGYAWHPDATGVPVLAPSRMSPVSLQQFLAGQDIYSLFLYGKLYGAPLPLSPSLMVAARRTLSKYDVRLVIVDTSVSGSGPVVKLFDDVLGRPRSSADHFSIWVTGNASSAHE